LQIFLDDPQLRIQDVLEDDLQASRTEKIVDLLDLLRFHRRLLWRFLDGSKRPRDFVHDVVIAVCERMLESLHRELSVLATLDSKDSIVRQAPHF
jgi:hypothetical protein